MDSRTRTQHRRNQPTTHNEPTEQDVAHLRPVPRLTPVDEAVRIVDMRELLAFRNRHLEELA